VKPDPEAVPAQDEANRATALGGRFRAVALLRDFADLRDGEAGPLGRASLFVFSLLASNYLVRPVRDEMGVAGGPEHLPALFAGTLAVMLLAWPVLSKWLGKRGAPGGVGAILRMQQAALLVFFAAFRFVPAGGLAWTARLFFVWASVTNLLIVSLAWGSLARRFRGEEARRLFGLIAAGGTLGAIAGSGLAGVLGRWAGPAPLLLPAVALIEIALRWGLEARAVPDDERADAATPSGAPVSRPEAGGRLYVACLGLWTLFFTMTSAFVYLEQARIVNASIHDPAVRTSLFARIDFLANVVGLAMQVLLTARIMKSLGAGGAAALLPAATLVGMVALSLRPTVATVQWFQVTRRAIDYAIARPSREVLYTAVAPRELFRAKGLIDTAVYRAGDAAGAWAYGLLAASPGLSRSAPAAVVAISVAWFALSVGLGRGLAGRTACDRERNYSA